MHTPGLLTATTQVVATTVLELGAVPAMPDNRSHRLGALQTAFTLATTFIATDVC